MISPQTSNLLSFVLNDPASLISTILTDGPPPALIPTLLGGCGLLMAVYGGVMGVRGGYAQMISSALKVPLLFILTLTIVLPALFVLNVLQGSTLGFVQMLSLMLVGVSLTSIVLAACAPITGFFGISSEYDFMKLLNVLIFGLAAAAGVRTLQQALNTAAERELMDPNVARTLFYMWLGVYSFVGMQMTWFLRPFLGEPSLPFELFRKRGGGLNFYSAVLLGVRNIFFRPGGAAAAPPKKKPSGAAACLSGPDGTVGDTTPNATATS